MLGVCDSFIYTIYIYVGDELALYGIILSVCRASAVVVVPIKEGSN